MLTHIFASLALISATIVDLKKREVPDTVSYGLMGVAVVLGLMQASLRGSWEPITTMLLGFGLGAVIGAGMFFLGQWGGGDAKLIFGLGGLFGYGTFFIQFLIFTIVAGAMYGLAYGIYLSIKNKKTFAKAFKKHAYTKKVRRIRATAQFLVFGALIIAFFLVQETFLRLVIVLSFAGMYFLFYAWLFSKVLEESCMKKKILVKDLVEGDWVLDDVVTSEKIICKKGKISPKMIKEITKIYDEKFPFIEVNYTIGKFLLPVRRKIRINKIKFFHSIKNIEKIGPKKIQGKVTEEIMNIIDEHCRKNSFKIVRKKLLGKEYVNPTQLVAGDVLVEDAMSRNLLYEVRTIGILKKDIVRLQKSKQKTVLVKEGIPFVPSFLLAYVFALIAQKIGFQFF